MILPYAYKTNQVVMQYLRYLRGRREPFWERLGICKCSKLAGKPLSRPREPKGTQYQPESSKTHVKPFEDHLRIFQEPPSVTSRPLKLVPQRYNDDRTRQCTKYRCWGLGTSTTQPGQLRAYELAKLQSLETR